MVRRLRASGGDSLGLLYGQGGHVTRHHALVLSRARGDPLAQDYRVQPPATEAGAQPPPLEMDYRGPAQLETFTVLYDGAGGVTHGVAILRTPAAARTMARVVEKASIARLTDDARFPIGDTGLVSSGEQQTPEWRFAP